MRNAEIAHQLGCYGVFVISMIGDDLAAADSAENIKKQFPNMKVGINALRLTQIGATKLSISRGLDMTWHDSLVDYRDSAELNKLVKSNNHEFYASFAFKYQLHDNHPENTAVELHSYFIPVTSGEATGKAADLDKVRTIYEKLKYHFDNPVLGIASGLTPLNIFN